MRIIDARGKACPIPVVMAKNEIEKNGAGFLITVDDMIAVKNIEKLSKSKCVDFSYNQKDDYFEINLNPGDGKPVETSNEDISCPINGGEKTGGNVIFIKSEAIGSGDEDLGKKLMEMFLFSLTEADNVPKAIVLMNGGVKLSTVNQSTCEHLSTLSKLGTEIVSCGACLNFFNLQDEVKVGKISNMFEISEIFLNAPKVISM